MLQLNGRLYGQYFLCHFDAQFKLLSVKFFIATISQDWDCRPAGNNLLMLGDCAMQFCQAQNTDLNVHADGSGTCWASEHVLWQLPDIGPKQP